MVLGEMYLPKGYALETAQAKQDYVEQVNVFRDFCRANGIRSHIKSETAKFVEGA